ncbi:protein FAM133 [Benincasa hispida]|uniref:protein FAM133 n=1 Tax=Benincasa hispida TaxID=102211 RepID=UPI0019011BAC|nr:protein FAM133 [Benincasa hispida]XP_038888946.1 protein FAM133 [Benincasa hispida]XP_038888947.1 protein FAM133 [Benincasa hispida]
MDLETENRIAAILMREAAELRRQAEKDGVEAFLRHPKVRGRPNSRFLTATVLGVQQANKAVEVNEMWRVRQKELELDDRLRGKSRDGNNASRRQGSFRASSDFSHDIPSSSSPSNKRVSEDCLLREDQGLKDEELEEFLHSRTKRGRGAVGSRMDETGPYLAPNNESDLSWPSCSNATDRSVVHGPERPSFLKSSSSSEKETDNDRRKRSKRSSHKQHRKDHNSKNKSEKKRRKESKKSKRHK